MPTYTQAHRPLEVFTPLGQDVLLLAGFSGQEAISRLFSFHLDLLADNETDIVFDKLLAQPITIRLGLPRDKNRYFNGICNRVSQGHRDQTFTSYRMEIVPQFWLLTRRAQSRIFQHISVPEILKKVLANTPASHPDMPDGSEIIYEEWTGETREDMRILQWEKVQELRSGKYTLWDHCFELPHKHLEAQEPILPDVEVGEVKHK